MVYVCLIYIVAQSLVFTSRAQKSKSGHNWRVFTFTVKIRQYNHGRHFRQHSLE